MRDIDTVYEEAYDLVSEGKPLSRSLYLELLNHGIDPLVIKETIPEEEEEES